MFEHDPEKPVFPGHLFPNETTLRGGDPNVKALRVLIADQHIYTSRWQPTADELDALNRGAGVYLTCYGVQPAVRLEAGFPDVLADAIHIVTGSEDPLKRLFVLEDKRENLG